MRLQIEQGALASGLQMVSRAVSNRTTLPVLTGILLEADGNRLTLSATDLEIAMRVQVAAQVASAGALVLPARYLSEYARHIPYGTIDIDADPATQRATLRWERSEYQIQGFVADQFPAVAAAGGDVSLSFPQDFLRQIIQQTAFAVSADETRPALTGVHMRVREGELLAIATDGFRVAVRRAPFDQVREDVDVILPGRALQEITRMLDDEEGEQATLSFATNQVYVGVQSARLSSRLIEGQYPNVLDLLPDAYPTRVRLERDALQQAAERASLLADRRLTARLIVCEFEPDRVVITSQDPEVGQAYEEVPAVREGEGIRIGLNARYLVDGLRQMQAEDVWVELIGPDKAVRVRAVDDEDYQYIVFPVRL